MSFQHLFWQQKCLHLPEFLLSTEDDCDLHGIAGVDLSCSGRLSRLFSYRAASRFSHGTQVGPKGVSNHLRELFGCLKVPDVDIIS